MDWFYDAESDDFFVSLQYKELLSEWVSQFT
jgi:hypothetical protein